MKYPMLREWKREIGWLILRFFRWVTRRSIRNCQTVLEMLDKTERELELAKKELQKAQDKLKDIERLATEAARAGAKVMAGEGVPRGQWSFAKGQAELGNKVLKVLGLKQYKPRPKVGKLFKKLF